ncbi:prosaposin-like isoform X2 [Danio aesculapii]|uniref:prosaposin-like isoform X2 n=2 Tax=Danio aesculapii TaxID=1142201 RepID=UPI0024BFE36F|nr:prosaposin-like isoform X2 [Danio aesculapii]
MTAFKLELLFLTALLGILGSVKTRSVDAAGLKNVPKGVDDTVTGDMCQDCTQIFELLKDLVSNIDFQEKQTEARLIATFEQACDSLPPKFAPICHNQVDKILPLAMTFITNFMNPSEICTYLGLCGGHDSGKIKDLLLNHMSKTGTMPTMKMESSVQCSVCTYIVSTLGFLFPKERTQNIITVLLESLCKEFPPLVQPQCNKLVGKYVQMLVDMLLNNTSPNFICTLLRLCEISERQINIPALSNCDSCLTLAVLTQMHLGSNATERQAASFLDTVCQINPSAMPKCETYIQRNGKQLSLFLSKQQGALDTCKSANLCPSDDKDSVISADPCSLGPKYSCRDLQTAVKCEAVSFCQKNVWA